MNYFNSEQKYIYCITNLINGKQYIGQAKNVQERFYAHAHRNENPKNGISLIDRAIKKYGEENFKIETLYYGENYNQKEKELIKELNTKHPNGYNLTDGGEEPPIRKGEKVNTAKLTQKEVEDIQDMLLHKKWKTEIIKKYPKVTKNIIERINKGETWYNDNLSYPLYNRRKIYGEVSKETALKIIQGLQQGKSILQIAEEIRICRKKDIKRNIKVVENFNSGLISNINDLYNGTFPISDVNEKKVKTISSFKVRQIEYDLLNTQLSYQKIAEKYSISYSTVYRINKGEIQEYINLELVYPLRINNHLNQKNINYINKKFQEEVNKNS